MEGEVKNIMEDLKIDVLAMVRNSNFTNNAANVAGGAIFTNMPRALYLSCGHDIELNETIGREFVRGDSKGAGTTGEELKTNRALFNSCMDTWHGNNARSTDGADLVATDADMLKVCTGSSDRCGDARTPLEIANHTSGSDLVPIFLDLEDAFNYLKFGEANALVRVTADSANAFVQHQVIVRVVRNTSLAGIRLQARIDQDHLLKLTFDPHIGPDIFIRVHVRGCLPGEAVEFNGELCILCKEGTYSFDPSNNCNACPSEHAMCRESTISPKDHFWHSTSKSTQIHRCILKVACQYTNRTSTVEEQARIAHSNSAFLEYHDNAGYAQCSKVGPLTSNLQTANLWNCNQE